VRYRAVADWAVLGRKLRSNLGKVKGALPGLSSDDVRSYTETGRVTVAGIELVEGDLVVQRYIELPEGEGSYATHTDNDVVVRLDIQVHPELAREWLARELISRVQKLRKKAGLRCENTQRSSSGLCGAFLRMRARVKQARTSSSRRSRKSQKVNSCCRWCGHELDAKREEKERRVLHPCS